MGQTKFQSGLQNAFILYPNNRGDCILALKHHIHGINVFRNSTQMQKGNVPEATSLINQEKCTLISLVLTGQINQPLTL